MNKWHFTICLGAAYLLIFTLWGHLEPQEVLISGIASTLVLGAGFGYFWKTGYFVNDWDGFFHVCVILDIILESTLVPIRETHNFYLCFAGFAAVIVGYRLYAMRARPPSAPKP